jgi:predicted AAA+ superfamily ATPase
MYRYKINELEKWKVGSNRKPLIILGARQVGKTWLIQEFGNQEYKQTVYINFEKMKVVQNLFEEDFDVQRILSALSIFARTAINPDDTLIVFDEIQAAVGGLTALKYFYEDAPQYHIISNTAIFVPPDIYSEKSLLPIKTTFRNTHRKRLCLVSIWFGNQYLRSYQKKTKKLFTA